MTQQEGLIVRQTPKEPPENGTFGNLGDMIAHHARTAPGREAILAPGSSPLTYGSLAVRVNDTVSALRRLGIGRHDRVAVVLPNGPDTAVAILAVAAGAVCVPLNPAFTADEWQRYFNDLQPAALLTRPDMNHPSRNVANSLAIPVIDLVPQPARGPCAFGLVGSARRSTVDDDRATAADDAFVLLTSGTTSRPKIVPLTHANVCRSAYNAGTVLGLQPADRLLHVLPLFHAHGLFSGLLAALAAGSSVVCTTGFNPDTFFGWLAAFEPTWYTAVPAIHRAVLSAAARDPDAARCGSLRVIRSASSSLPPGVLSRLEALFGVPVIETYGMTEAASQIAANPLARRKSNSVGPSAGAEIAIMDADSGHLPAGERGEIVLRGPTMTRGYDNDADATAAAFRDGWFRTGDLGYLDADGYLFVLGRLKDIINRGGQKIAPAEVEEALLSHPAVAEAVAFSIPNTRLGEDVAAAVVLRPDARASARTLQNFARGRLAAFKVPAVIRFVPEIPKGASGKINRSSLAAALSIAAPGPNPARSAPPRSDLERTLAETWSDLLETSLIGIDQDVFALGADSLTVTQMLSRVRTRFGVDISFKDILDAPTVAALAAHLESSASKPAPPPPTAGDTPAPASRVGLSIQQQRINLLSRLDPTGTIYHVMDVVRLAGTLDIDALQAAIGTICQRHEVLRSTFHEAPDEPEQTVGTATPRLERVDIGPCRDRSAVLQIKAREALRQTFDLARQPALRAQLLRFDDDDHALVITLHHLVTDGWSQRLFWEELETLYAAPADLPALPAQYRHFVEWQRSWLQSPAAREQLNYWRKQLDGLTELPLRTDRPRPETWTGHGARYPIELPLALSRDLKALSRTSRVTLFMTLLAAFQCLLHRYTGHDDIAVGSLNANRNRIEFERLMGMFANTIVLRTDLAGDPTFSELLQRVRTMTLDAFRNQDLPVEHILQVLPVSRDSAGNALFRVMFILQNGSPRAPSLPGLSAQFVDVDPATARFDLTLELLDTDGRLTGWLEYSTDLFDTATIARMAEHLRTLLGSIIASPNQRISRLALLQPEERSRIILDCNQTALGPRRPGSFSERFANQVARTPDAIAVSEGRRRVSYRELAHRSQTIANGLAANGAAPDAIIILLMERNIDFLAAMIAVQQAGAAFLPLDPALPTARLTQIIRHSRARLVLAEPHEATSLDQALSAIADPPPVLNLDELTSETPHNPVRPAPSSLASVIYTSGSTGTPKGAMIEQRGLINHLLSKVADLELSASDVIAQTAPQSFVISIWQFLTGVTVGARVCILSDEQVRDPALLVAAIGRDSVTVLQIVPSLLRAILERTPGDPAFRTLGRLRFLVTTGEALPADLLRDWLRHFPGVPVINAYGASECSDDVATHHITTAPASLATVPIGRPIANTSLYVLDTNLEPVPTGVAGELYVGGSSVGRGYLDDPEQTRRSFLRDPFSKRRGARLYRTGDIARWRPDRTLEFLGRTDHQVKIRGHRIELGEIERALLAHPDVQAAVVLARHDRAQTRLIGYLVASPGQQPDALALRDFLAGRLPAYMIPTGFVFLDGLPLTPHGKVDRGALAKISPGVSLPGDDRPVAPRHPTEHALAAIWSDVLDVADVGVFDNFFDLGGHSLLAGRLLMRAGKAFGMTLPISALFEAPTINALARRVDQLHQAQPIDPALEITRLDETGTTAMSFTQQHMLEAERALPGLPQFNLPFAYRLQGSLDIAALSRSLIQVVRRHDQLRTGFVWLDGQPVAVVAPPTDNVSPLVVEDLAASAAGNDRATALLLEKALLQAEQHAWTPFDLARPPLFSARLLRLGAADHVLLLTLHHIIVDGWSIGVFFEEISESYAAFAAGREALLPEPALRFSDFASWQRRWSSTEAAARQSSCWTQQLQGAKPIFPVTGDHADAAPGSPTAHDPVDLPNDLVERLTTLSRVRGVTLFMTLLTGFKALLLLRSGRNDICVATAMANRSQPGTDRIIGPLQNTALIRTRIDVDLSFQAALGRVSAAVLDAHARQQLPFHMIAAQMQEAHGQDPASLIQAFFVMRNAARQLLELQDVMVKPFGDIHREGQPVLPIDRTWLTMTLRQTPSGIIGSCSHKTSLFEPDAVMNWVDDYKAILAKVVINPDTSLGNLVDCRT